MSLDELKSFESHCEEIAQHLECPVCLDFAKPPVKQCINGHICCFSCGNLLHICPMCRYPFAQTHSLINDIVYSFVDQCPFKYYGCQKILSPMEYDNHVENCPYRQILCKICFQKVYAEHIWNHLFTKHEGNIWMGESNVLRWRKFKFSKNFEVIEVIKAFNQLFWYCSSNNITKQSFNIAVQFIGSKLQAEKYYYEVDTGAYSVSDNRLTFRRTTHHCMDSARYIFQTDGISIKHDFIFSLLQNDLFVFNLNLYKKKEKSKREETKIVRTILLSGS